MELKYKRVLLKVSGEALAGAKKTGLVSRCLWGKRGIEDLENGNSYSKSA